MPDCQVYVCPKIKPACDTTRVVVSVALHPEHDEDPDEDLRPPRLCRHRGRVDGGRPPDLGVGDVVVVVTAGPHTAVETAGKVRAEQGGLSSPGGSRRHRRHLGGGLGHWHRHVGLGEHLDHLAFVQGKVGVEIVLGGGKYRSELGHTGHTTYNA